MELPVKELPANQKVERKMVNVNNEYTECTELKKNLEKETGNSFLKLASKFEENQNYFKNIVNSQVYRDMEIKFLTFLNLVKKNREQDLIEFYFPKNSFYYYSFALPKNTNVLLKPYFANGASRLYFYNVNVTEILHIERETKKSQTFKFLSFREFNPFTCLKFFNDIYNFLHHDLEEFSKGKENSIEKEFSFTSFFSPSIKFKLLKDENNQISLCAKVSPERINTIYYLVNGVNWISYDPYMLKFELLSVGSLISTSFL